MWAVLGAGTGAGERSGEEGPAMGEGGQRMSEDNAWAYPGGEERGGEAAEGGVSVR